MRKKSSMQNGGYQQHRKQRYNPGGGGGGGDRHHHSGGNRPRRNYSATREKYLAQARDALASGDRVLAENYLQHADHCYRMMMEEGFRPNANPSRPQGQPGEEAQPQQQQDNIVEAMPAANTGQLPAFITRYEPDVQKNVPPAQNWEDRDEG